MDSLFDDPQPTIINIEITINFLMFVLFFVHNVEFSGPKERRSHAKMLTFWQSTGIFY